ncbi:MmgE/PrpD family protein [Pseudomonas baltica]|uniref:MmgE/PrpD family protein n=1 Tax=Pseudomonas baltica TaxID=2762576 RepID=UPI00289BADC4|nr:MmgE/PrpD family protein [Pseudomonas baltica]
MPAESITQQIARAAMGLSVERLPGGLLNSAKDLIGDLLLAAAAGQAEPSSRAFSAAITGAPGTSRLWFSQTGALAPADATFANTLSAAALDYDSLNGAVHADLVTLPAAWAAAEHCQRSPQDMLVAYIAASELVSRLSRCAQGPGKGWSATALYGGIGAALASGLLLRLIPEQLVHALGLAALQAAGSQQANVEQTLAKRLQPALAARHGVQAALLAQAGATAPIQALEGRFGLRALYQPGDDTRLLDGWGERWQLLDTATKRYPVCACSHAAVQALLDLRQREPFESDEVLEVTALISPFMARLVGGAFNPAGDLQVVAQFNLQYQLASVLLRGPLTLQHLTRDAVLDAAAWVTRIKVEIDAGNQQELAPASVRVRLRDGQVLSCTCRYLPGSAQAPLSVAERLAKARECGQRAQPAFDGIALFERLADLDQHERLPLL